MQIPAISTRISLPIANLGEIPGKITPRFLPPWICFLARILARFAAGSRQDFGRRDFCFPVRILARFVARSRRDFGRREFRFPERILPGSRRDSRWEEKSWQPKSRRDPGGIPAENAAGSRQDPGPYFTRDGSVFPVDPKNCGQGPVSRKTP